MSKRGVLLSVGAVIVLVALLAGVGYLAFATEDVTLRILVFLILTLFACIWCAAPLLWRETNWWQRQRAHRLGYVSNLFGVIWVEALGVSMLDRAISGLFRLPLGWPIPPSWVDILTLFFFRIIPGICLALWLIVWVQYRLARRRARRMAYEQGEFPINPPRPRFPQQE